MTKAVVLGGAGGIGRVAAKTISVTDDFDEIVIADLNKSHTDEVVKLLDRKGIVGREVDATSQSSLKDEIHDADVVINCIGPFYRFGEPILRAAIESKVNYVDVCDDLDATEKQLNLFSDAERNKVLAIIGLGNSPGLANLLAKFGAEDLMDECHSVEIMHIHGGEAFEGKAVIGHRIHAMVNDVPVFEDSKFKKVRLLEESGLKYVQEVEFRDVGKYPVYPYPHPETITLPKYINGLKKVTNRGVVFPIEYFNLTMDVVREGLKVCENNPSEEVIDEWAESILSQRSKLLEKGNVTGPKGCLKIVLNGIKEKKSHTVIFSVSSTSDGAGAGTGIPAGLGAIMISRKLVDGVGVYPPEAVISPLQALGLASDLLPKLELNLGSSGTSIPLHIDQIFADGSIQELPLTL